MTAKPAALSKSGRFDSIEQEVYLNLWRTYDRLRAFEDELFARFDLTPQQYNVLRLLDARRPDSLPTLTIAARLISKSPDITRILDKLEARHLIVRNRPPENRRTVNVSISPTGIELVSKIAGPLRDCHRRQLGHLSDSELQRLADMLRRAREPHETDHEHWG